jgi:16S rRNA (cytidine1402-2'-O)-methyltransferase
MAGILYIVATPIGNLDDITLRAIDVLKEVDIIFAEDTRVTSRLLSKFEINKTISSYHQHSLLAKREEILQSLIEGKQIALVADAGTPGISDPGNELIDFILQYLPPSTVVPVPGASSLTAALSVCGFSVNKFIFLGFLPKKKRAKLLAWVREGQISLAFFESPHRIYKTLREIGETVGMEKRVLVAREITKIHETLYRGTIGEVIKNFDNTLVKGEIVVILEQY